MPRPRLFVMPTICSVEWTIKPQLEEWAEVVIIDAPGIGEEPAGEGTTGEAIVAKGIAELDRLGWDSYVLVGDEVGAAQALRLAARRPQGIVAIALGHPSPSLRSTGPDAPLNREVVEALARLARTDFRSFVRAMTQVTQSAYDDEIADRYMERVSVEALEAYMPDLLDPEANEDLLPVLRSLQVPALLVEHVGCLMWTPRSFQQAVAAVPGARTAGMELKPSVNPEFAELLREFCEGLPAGGPRDADLGAP